MFLQRLISNASCCFFEKPAWTIIITFSAAVMNTEEESQQCQQHLYIITKFEAVESSECL